MTVRNRCYDKYQMPELQSTECVFFRKLEPSSLPSNSSSAPEQLRGRLVRGTFPKAQDFEINSLNAHTVNL